MSQAVASQIWCSFWCRVLIYNFIDYRGMICFSLVILLIIAYGNSLRYYPSAKSGNTVYIEVFGESRCIHTTTFLREQLLPE
ncbi:hypothetical protein OSTOST_21070 [Ostertagia ostertagi]